MSERRPRKRAPAAEPGTASTSEDMGAQTTPLPSPPRKQPRVCVGESVHGFGINTRSKKRNAFGPEADILLDRFTKWQVRNPTSVFATQVDDHQCLRCVFWADARARVTYSFFSDVIVFDTSCKMNGSKLLFAQFLGINNHAHPVFLGGALMALDSDSSFTWVFRSWLETMHGRQPGCIVTDRQKNIRLAVSKVCPQSHHRLCTWRILEKIPKKLGDAYATDTEFYRELFDCIYKSAAPSAFEDNWASLLNKYTLQSSKWLQSLYTERERWVPAYDKGTFSAGVLSKADDDHIRSPFDKHISESTNLVEFIKQYDRALQVELEREDDEDYKTTHLRPEFRTPIPMEQQAADFYTRVIFLKFQKEFIESLAGCATQEGNDAEIETFIVKEIGRPNDEFTVKFTCEDMRANCSCHLFESDGIPCRHVLTVFKFKQIFTLPDHFILKRWTRKARTSKLPGDGNIQPVNNGPESNLLRFNNMFIEAIKVIDIAASCNETYLMTMHGLGDLWDKLGANKEGSDQVSANRSTEMKEGSPLQKSNSKHSAPKITFPGTRYLDATDQISGSREKSDSAKKAPHSLRKCRMVEEDHNENGDHGTLITLHKRKRSLPGNLRTCSFCKKFGNHDSRNCPLKPK